ncbi:MAG: putative Prepilin peptidase [Candidatus Saccharibacteria bacterium]|nr:putative Prepilin peptidase [Candidatus Saccharibacteria bacterium]
MSVFTIAILLGFLGLFMGSFAGASVWRLRARQLRLDEKAGEKISKAEKTQVAKLKKQSLLNDRSVCLHCGHQLAWYDLVPLVSWLELGGKCRYCGKPIGKFEPLIEVATGLFFVVSYLFWPTLLSDPYALAHFAIWLIAGVGLITLSVYDFKWFLLPNPVVFTLIGLGFVNSLLVLVQDKFMTTDILSILAACGFLSGLYYVIYVGSRHQWVGFGDIKLGLALALLLANWQQAALALFLANAIGTLIFLPLMLSGKVERQARIPFGPLLISGWFFAGLFGPQIISWYLKLALGVS